jgi:hypothetical protein
MAHEIEICQHIKPNGRRCGSPCLEEDDYCYFHRDQRERYKRQLRNVRRQQQSLHIPALEDRETIQVAIGDVLNALIHDRIDSKKAGLILYGLQTAAANVNRCDFLSEEDDEEFLTEYDETEQTSLEAEIAEEIAVEAAAAPKAKPPQPKTPAATAAPKKPPQSASRKHILDTPVGVDKEAGREPEARMKAGG